MTKAIGPPAWAGGVAGEVYHGAWDRAELIAGS